MTSAHACSSGREFRPTGLGNRSKNSAPICSTKLGIIGVSVGPGWMLLMRTLDATWNPRHATYALIASLENP